MIEKSPIIVLDESEGAGDNCNSSSEIISLDLDIFGEPVHFRIGVSQRQARLADIVPLSRTLSTKLAIAVLNKLSKDGKFVPCRKACSACCSYLIPLSIPEVFRLRQELLALSPDQREMVLKACLDTAKVILNNLPENIEINESIEMNGQIQTGWLSRWYSGLKQPCPFLSHGLCTIYEQRPIACREHIVTGSAILCEAEWQDGSQVVQMPLSIIECLGHLTAELEQSAIEAVMLPLALPWAQENLARHERQWPAIMMVERFVEIVKAKASENAVAAATTLVEHPALAC